MERTERDIIDFMKRYKDKPEAMAAQADMLAFMGIPEAPIFYDNALQEIKNEKTFQSISRREYTDYIRRGSRYYCSYEEFIRRKEAGQL